MEARLGIMQSYFFPYLGYFQLIDAVDDFVLYGKVTFRKKSWITRNRLLDKGTGSPFYINIPVKKQSCNKTIEEIEIDHSQAWKKKLLDLLFFNYKKALFFDEVYPKISQLLQLEEISLHKFNAMIVAEMSTWIGITTNIQIDNNEFEEIERRLYNQLDIEGQVDVKTQRIFDICSHMKKKHYVNPIGGVDLYDKELFVRNNYEVSFVKSLYPIYNQFGLEHVPHLSILDVLMHNGFEGTTKLVKQYTLL